MNEYFLRLLRCPHCEGELNYSVVIEGAEDKVEWGSLMCQVCSAKFPVAFGIPILQPSDKRVDVILSHIQESLPQNGPFVYEIIQKIESGDIQNVKEKLLLYRWPRTTLKRGKENNWSSKFAAKLPNSMVKLIGKRNLFMLYWIITKITFQDLRMKNKEDRLFRKLLSSSTAFEFIDGFFIQLMKNKVYADYYKYRFGQPRHLVTLSLLSNIPVNEYPVLDIACGAGHLMHYFNSRNIEQPVVGMDKYFAQLYLAKKYIAPEGNYFCADADQPLPFKKNTFTGIYCSDAFMFFSFRSASVREMQRTLRQNGVIIISRISNLLGEEYINHARVSPEQIKEYFNGFQNIIVAHDEALERYKNKLGVDLSSEQPIEISNKLNWFSIIASSNRDVFVNHKEFVEWPHAMGNLNMNPLYAHNGTDAAGNRKLKFTFPSKWYEYENVKWKEYAPESITLNEGIMGDINKKRKSPELEELISQVAVIGLPSNFY